MRAVHATLNAWGIGRRDRVALVVPQGPELAAAFLALAPTAGCVPLNPSCRASEFDFFLSDPKISAVIVQSDTDSPVRQAARARAIRIIDLTSDGGADAGLFTLSGAPGERSTADGFATPDDIALVLYTSGTTAQPKKVAETHHQICVRAWNTVAGLELTAQDCCLNMLSLYHEAGLQAVYGTIASGGTLVCPPLGQHEAFFEWIEKFRPSWYNATPPTHHAILALAQHQQSIIARCPLRFIRSGAGALSPRLAEALEHAFGAPVIETYGMTETGLICTNPFPPRIRKMGSVGVSAGPELAIMDGAGAFATPGTTGEVAVRGPGVIQAYEGQPDATAAAFRSGWFRTGDLGVLDSDGYLFLKGRLKDVINRGGQKVTPREVEEALLTHPAVAEAVAFPLPHPTLGEDVAAAVVFRTEAAANEQELRHWAARRLTQFKVPRRIVPVAEIPTDPNGKVRRAELAAHFVTLLQTPFQSAERPLEEALTRIWAEELGVDRVGVHDNYFDMGGDSLSAARVCARAAELAGRPVPVDSLFRAPTVRELAHLFAEEDASHRRSSLVPLQTGGPRPPLFCVHNAMGAAGHYAELARHLGPDQPVYGVRAYGVGGSTHAQGRLESIAARYVEEIRAVFPQGPYLLCGYSFGGIVAWEVAQQLRALGQQVALLALFDAPLFFHPSLKPGRASTLQFCIRRVLLHLERLRALSARDWLHYLTGRLQERRRRVETIGSDPGISGSPPRDPRPGAAGLSTAGDTAPSAARFHMFRRSLRAAVLGYLPSPYAGPIALFLARQSDFDLRYDPRLPGTLATGAVKIYKVPGDHGAFVKGSHVREIARMLRDCIDRAIERRPDRPAPGRPVAPRGRRGAAPRFSVPH